MPSPDHRDVPSAATPALARREFLRWLGVGLAAPAAVNTGLRSAALPGLQDPEQDPDQDPAPRSELVAADVAAAFRRARGWGKPLLVAVIPYGRAEDEPEVARTRAILQQLSGRGAEGVWPPLPAPSEVGLRLGRALRYADGETLAALATTEFVAADTTELRELLEVEALPDAALLVVEPDGEVHVAIEELAPLELNAAEGRFGKDPQAEQKARALALRFGARLRAALFGDDARVARRLAVHAARLGEALVTFEAPDDGSEQDLQRCAPAYLAAAPGRDDPEQRAPWIERLVALARGRYVEQGPVGARWAESEGCGSGYLHVEGPGLGIACGMGFVAEVNSRFLAFRIR